MPRWGVGRPAGSLGTDWSRRLLTLVIVMLLILLVGGAVIAYVAFPHRGEDLPVVPALGEAMRKGADALPTLEDEGEGGTWSLDPTSTR